MMIVPNDKTHLTMDDLIDAWVLLDGPAEHKRWPLAQELFGDIAEAYEKRKSEEDEDA